MNNDRTCCVVEFDRGTVRRAVVRANFAAYCAIRLADVATGRGEPAPALAETGPWTGK
jgi:hypothetical protein